MDERIRVLIADDHPMFREGVEHILESAGGFHITGEAGTAAEAFRRAREDPPDVVLLDISLPDVDGLSALPQIRDAGDGTAVLVLSMHSDRSHAVRALEVGADGYIGKQSAARVLVDGIRAVYRGERYFDDMTMKELGSYSEDAEQDDVPEQFEVEDPMKNEGDSIERIGEFLRRIGALSEEQVGEVLDVQSRSPEKKFGQIAVELGHISSELIDRYLSSHRAG
ncbi:MAG: response regulator transcription factor [Spirochaetaceae bacterium]